ncbi:Mycolic acid cyclopropane synthetase-domain-containing protein [Blastocladiella britannica]|nr:Mycolic acid cyclopropane synthetase-domain-containing protein [Blastocladiella britannica]
MASLISSLTSSLSSLNPVPSFGKRVFLGLLESLRIGTLTVVLEYDGNATFEFGARSPFAPPKPDDASVYMDLTATLRVLDEGLWARLVVGGDMGFAEAYMAGEVEADDMAAFLLIMAKNKPYLSDPASFTSWAMTQFDYLSHSRLANTVKTALSNISAHYDLSNDMFAAFLDPRMQYSCALWDWNNLRSDSLEDAQLRKISTVVAKAQLNPNSKLLEIGSGWGGLAVEAVRQSGGCNVVTITLSVEQKVLAEARVRRAENEGYIPKGRVQVLLCDYRNLPDRFPAGHFDAIVSVEMIEAVGREFLTEYFRICHTMMHPTHGIMVLQAITMPEARAASYAKSCDFIQKYIFPGGFLPSISQIASAVETASEGQLTITHAKSYAPHYARTLQAWRARFVKAYPTVKRAAVAGGGTDSDEGEDSGHEEAPVAPNVTAASSASGGVFQASDKAYTSVAEIEGVKRRTEIGTDQFFRKFLYYFDYCTAGFAARVIDLYQIVLTREGCEAFLDGPYAEGSLAFVPADVDA